MTGKDFARKVEQDITDAHHRSVIRIDDALRLMELVKEDAPLLNPGVAMQLESVSWILRHLREYVA